MIRVLLAHPSRLICDSLRSALDHEADVYVVGCATTAEELYFLLPHGNVVLLGTHLEDITAFDILDEIRLSHPQMKVLVMGVDDKPEMLVRYVEAGAMGYILQSESGVDMVQKLQATCDEKALVSPAVAAAMMQRLTHLANLDAPFAVVKRRNFKFNELTMRERQVLDLVTEGQTNREIAEELVIEYGTAKNHVHNIMRKLEVHSRQSAATIYQIN